jgi:hypothetical protein
VVDLQGMTHKPDMKVFLPKSTSLRFGALMCVTYTAVLPVRAETVAFLAGLLAGMTHDCFGRGVGQSHLPALDASESSVVMRW